MNKYLNSFIFLIVLFFLTNIQEYFPSKTIFVIYTSLLILYLMIEIVILRIKNNSNYLLNPALLASCFTFILGFGVTNYLFLSEDSFYNWQLYERFGLNAFGYLADAMPLVIIGAIAMWAGYHSGLGQHLFQLMTGSIIQVKKYLRVSFEIRFKLISSLFFFSLLARILAINLGIFGYAQDPETVIELSAIDLPLN